MVLRSALLCLAVVLSTASARAEGLSVFAAASMKTAFDAIAEEWQQIGRVPPVLVYAGTSTLARQIDQGAPADLIVTANIDWMDWLQDRDLIDTDSRRSFLGNRLVVVAPTGAPPITLTKDGLLGGLGDDGKLAMALVESVPAGLYGKAALTTLGLWPAVVTRVAQTDNVRAALALVARAEAPLGIVYASDAKAEARVDVVAVFPAETHPPIRYAIATTRDSQHPDTADFLTFLGTDAAKAIFVAQAFEVLP